jgi:hypothetical protein
VSHRQTGSERAAVSLLVLALLVLSTVVVSGVARVGDGVLQRARLDALADMVALAAVSDDPDDPRSVTESVAAELVEVRVRADGAVEVTIRRHGLTATAAAVGLPDGATDGSGVER